MNDFKNNIIPCPVCQTYAFSKDTFPGSYDICNTCRWEDDDVQFKDPDFEGGANDVSLNEARRNFQKYGISDPSKISIPRSWIFS